MEKKEIELPSTLKKNTAIRFPRVQILTGSMLDQLTDALGVDRNIIALDDQIEHAWSGLPRLIERIPLNIRDEEIVKACIAVASGLFDAAINYVWNATTMELREKVRQFGIHVVPQILADKPFDENNLVELRDAELLDLCLKLNLITDENFFFLDQCRAMRNSYSVAHPSGGNIDEDEVLNFISRCQKHAMSRNKNPKGVDTKELLNSLNSTKFKKSQREEWEERIRDTYDAQREMIFSMLHGIYCDPSRNEKARINALEICKSFSERFTSKTQTKLVDRHQDYRARGDDKRYKASTKFFQDLGLISLLSDMKVHSLISSSAKNLLRVHNGLDNFYNEPPFAAHLEKLARDVDVPESAKALFVEAIITCGIGNMYGVSIAAMPS